MKYNTKTITIQVDAISDAVHYDDFYQTAGERTKNRAEALAILVGGEYNRYGRHINHDTYEDLVQKFNNLLYEMEELNKN